MDTPEITALLAWLRTNLAELVDSRDAWQITLHGGPAGDVKVEVSRKQQLIATQKERRNGHTNGYLRSVQ